MSHLEFLGAAYAAVWLLIFFYVWRLTRTTRGLSDRLDKLESASRQDPGA